MTAPGPQFSTVVPPGDDVMHSAMPGRYYLGCSDTAAIDRHLAVLTRRFLGPGSRLEPEPRALYLDDRERLLDLRMHFQTTEQEAA